MPQIHTAIIALGSNIGDRAAIIHAGLEAMRSYATIDETSFLYETPAAYLTDQPDFLNAVCRIHTVLSPTDLLKALQQTEHELGRVRLVRYGPRSIDLDILFYDELIVEQDELTIPHPRMAERDFVLQPLMDIAPDFVHPVLRQPVHALWTQLKMPPLPRVTPLGKHLWTWGKQTYIMGVINATPDSFSGDGLFAEQKRGIGRAVTQAESFVAFGAHCLDIGGQSTRPGHELVSEDEEIERIVPIIEAVSTHVDVPISVDTFRAKVARAAIEAGAHFINDVWGMRFEPMTCEIAAEIYAPLVVMYNQTQPSNPEYGTRITETHPLDHDDILVKTQIQLQQQLNKAMAAGLPRWLLIADPGMGYGQPFEDQIHMVRNFDMLAREGVLGDYPWLFGPSRKGFVGHLLGGAPREERDEGTAALCALAIERGADIIRVHDVKISARVARVVDAVMR
ncbi:MAG: dihydropteroate synthase [Chloroflexota bacterium]